MARFQTLKSIVIDIPERWVRSDNGDSLMQAIAHHACGLKLLYSTCNRSELRSDLFFEVVAECKQLRQLMLILNFNAIVSSCKISPTSILLSS